MVKNSDAWRGSWRDSRGVCKNPSGRPHSRAMTSKVVISRCSLFGRFPGRIGPWFVLKPGFPPSDYDEGKSSHTERRGIHAADRCSDRSPSGTGFGQRRGSFRLLRLLKQLLGAHEKRARRDPVGSLFVSLSTPGLRRRSLILREC